MLPGIGTTERRPGAPDVSARMLRRRRVVVFVAVETVDIARDGERSLVVSSCEVWCEDLRLLNQVSPTMPLIRKDVAVAEGDLERTPSRSQIPHSPSSQRTMMPRPPVHHSVPRSFLRREVVGEYGV